MKLLDFLTEVSTRSGIELTQSVTNGETLKSHLLRGFNLYYKDFNNRHPWPWREKTTVIQVVPNYISGTVALTQGSRNVTGSGTSFTTAMEGRFLKLDSDSELYEILSVTNGTTLILKTPYLKAASSGSYLIWKKYYDLDPDVPYLAELLISQWPFTTDPIPKKDFNNVYLRSYSNSQFPSSWCWYGVNRKVSTYTTGSVTTTQDSRILTGTGTLWVGNVFNGSKVTIGTISYNIESVDTDTQITLVQNATIVATGSAYSIETKNTSQIVLSSVPDPAINLYVTYPKKTYSLINDNDETELWEGFEHILANVLYGYYLEKLTSENAFKWISIYEGQVKEAWKNLADTEPLDKALRYQRKSISGYRRSLYGN